MSRVALITGASRGLGATLAAFLAGQDYDLVLTARGEPELAATAHALSHYGNRIIALAGDVTHAQHRQRLAEAAHDLHGLDLLVNNASALGPTPLPHLIDYAPADLEQVLRTNVIAPIALVQETASLLEGQGLVVNVSSDAAVGAYAGWGGYGASKAALDLASATLAGELRERNIAVVSVDPGDMRTRMQQDAFPSEDISDRPLPTVTIPFWAWLLGQDRGEVSGRRYRAQADRWEVAA